MARLCLFLAVPGLLALGGWLYAREWAPGREAFPTQGVSVSSDNGPIDWGTLAAQGADFAYIRASSGGRFRAPAFAANSAGARGGGVRDGDPERAWGGERGSERVNIRGGRGQKN